MAAGAAGVVIDWERRGKRRRQAFADTQVNFDTPEDLRQVCAATRGLVLCRVNGWGPGTTSEIEVAIANGADEILLPMVRRPSHVDAALDAINGRCRLGILVETGDAVACVAELVRRPLSRVYLGLNDLMIDRGGSSLFAPLVDGTAEHVALEVSGAGIPFGLAGLTLPDRGYPVPSRLLMAELVRVGASFTFLRRSFHADMVGRDPAVELPRMKAAISAARRRPRAARVAHRLELESVVGVLEQPAV